MSRNFKFALHESVIILQGFRSQGHQKGDIGIIRHISSGNPYPYTVYVGARSGSYAARELKHDQATAVFNKLKQEVEEE